MVRKVRCVTSGHCRGVSKHSTFRLTRSAAELPLTSCWCPPPPSAIVCIVGQNNIARHQTLEEWLILQFNAMKRSEIFHPLPYKGEHVDWLLCHCCNNSVNRRLHRWSSLHQVGPTRTRYRTCSPKHMNTQHEPQWQRIRHRMILVWMMLF